MDDKTNEHANVVPETGGAYLLGGVLVGGSAVTTTAVLDLTGSHKRRRTVVGTTMVGILGLATTVVLLILWLLGLFA